MLSSDRIRGPTRFGKGLNLIFPQLSSQNMRGFDHATIFSPSFHGLRKERLAQWPPFCVLNTTKKFWGVPPEKLVVGVQHASWNPVIFPTLFQTWSKIWYPFSDLKPWSPARLSPGLALCFQPHSRPFLWLLARTWVRKNTHCFAV